MSKEFYKQKIKRDFDEGDKQLYLYRHANVKYCPAYFSIDVGISPYNAVNVINIRRGFLAIVLDMILVWVFRKLNYCIYYGVYDYKKHAPVQHGKKSQHSNFIGKLLLKLK